LRYFSGFAGKIIEKNPMLSCGEFGDKVAFAAQAAGLRWIDGDYLPTSVECDVLPRLKD